MMIGEPAQDRQSALNEASAKAQHDMRASLAIAQGFTQALGSSFSELCEELDRTLNHTQAPETEHMKQLRADCQFCLSRISRSLGQLAERVQDGPVISTVPTGSADGENA